MEMINLEGETVQQAVRSLNNENIVQVKVEPSAKKVLVQFLQCSACPQEFSDAQFRVAHINISHPKVMQKEAWTPCHKCHMRFPRKDVLRDHAKRVHQGGKSKCFICDEVFWTDALFRQHWKKCMTKWMKSHKNEEENAALQEQLIRELNQQQQEQHQQNGQITKNPLGEEPMQVQEDQENNEKKPEISRNDYLCAFCHFIFTTKAGYMEHTKMGNCIQPTAAHSGKYKYTSPVPCYYCPAHCASRKALQAHVKEAHAVVQPEAKDQEDSKTINSTDSLSSGIIPVKEKEVKKHIYPCRPCNRKFEDLKSLENHTQNEHFECDNCFKFFSQEDLEGHKVTNDDGTKTCTISCPVCGDNPRVVFLSGEAFVDHMNEKHRSIVGVQWFQCVHCLKLNKRYFNRYYPTKRSLQLHMASIHNFVNAPKPSIIVNSDSLPTKPVAPVAPTTPVTAPETLTYTTAPGSNEIFVPITALPQTEVQHDENGQQIIQQFQIQLPEQQVLELAAGQQHQVVSGDANQPNQTQQIQIIQTDPNNPDQPQVITLYTWGGN